MKTTQLSKTMTTIKRLTRSVAGSMTYLRRPKVLHFNEEKPIVYGMQAVRGSIIKDQAVIAYAAKAAHVPESTILMAMGALVDAINFFCTQGRRVEVPGLGSFAAKTRCKVTRNEEECNTDTIKQHGRVLMFWPSGDVRDMVMTNGITFTESKSLTNMACGLLDKTEDGTTFLVNAEGQTIVMAYNGHYYRFVKSGNSYSAEQTASNKLGANEVEAFGTMTDNANGNIRYGNTEYTLVAGVLTPQAGKY